MIKELNEKIKDVINNITEIDKNEKNELNTFSLNDFNENIKTKLIYYFIKKYNVLKLNKSDFLYNTLKYETFENVAELENKVKKLLLKYDKTDKIKELNKEIWLNLEKYNKHFSLKTYENLFNLNFNGIKKLYDLYLKDINKEIVLNYSVLKYNNTLDIYKIENFKKIFIEYFNFVFDDNFLNLSDVDFSFFKNRKVKINIADKEKHKKVNKYLIDDYIKNKTFSYYVLFDSLNEKRYKYLNHRFTLYHNNINIFVEIKLNMFDFEKLNEMLKLYKLSEFSDDLNFICDYGINEVKTNDLNRMEYIKNNINNLNFIDIDKKKRIINLIEKISNEY